MAAGPETTATTSNTVATIINGSAQTSNTFSTLAAEFALKGHTLHQTNPTDGPVTYWAERWGLVRHLPTLHDVALFLAQIGGRL